MGGPITLPKALFGPLGFNGRDRAFFFLNYENSRRPNQANRTRTVFNPLTQQGVFQYLSGGSTKQVDLLALAGSKGQTSTIDPTIEKLLADMRSSTAQGSIKPTSDPQYVQYKKGDPAYNASYKDFAPSFGFAWSPNRKGGWLGRIVGGDGKTVLRGGFSVAYNRNGMYDYSQIFSAIPGMAINATRNVANGNLVTGKVLGETLPHAFKINWVYELPIGSGKALVAGAHGLVDRIAGGWEFHGTGRILSGNPEFATVLKVLKALGLRLRATT